MVKPFGSFVYLIPGKPAARLTTKLSKTLYADFIPADAAWKVRGEKRRRREPATTKTFGGMGSRKREREREKERESQRESERHIERE
jgi:hypothetical protein